MSRRASPTLIGAFVLGAVGIAIAGVLAFGGGALFTSKVTYVAYFEGSVSGLNVGAAVEFRGVRIGSVSEIDLRVNAEDATVRIPVYLALSQDRVIRSGSEVGPAAIIDELIAERGLKAQLHTQSLVTGQLVVNLDFHPEFEAKLVGADPEYPEIPTIPSNLQQIQQTAREALAKLSQLPLEDLVSDLRAGLAGFSDLVNSPETRTALANLNRALEDVRALASRIDGRVDPLANDVEATLAEARETLEQAQQTLRALQSMVGDDAGLGPELARTLQELSEAARAVRILADTLDREPESLLRGKRGR